MTVIPFMTRNKIIHEITSIQSCEKPSAKGSNVHESFIVESIYIPRGGEDGFLSIQVRPIWGNEFKQTREEGAQELCVKVLDNERTKNA